MKIFPSNYTKLLATILAITTLPLSANVIAKPKFKPGEVVFSGAVPPELSDKVTKRYNRSKLTVVSVPVGLEIAELNKAKRDGYIGGLNYIATSTVELGEAGYAPNDPYFEYQWHMQQLGVPAIWSIATGADVRVAVIDSGIAVGQDGVNICDGTGGYDFAYGDSDPDDRNGHGTHVSGTIAQTTGNNTGVVGLAPSACVIPLKALNDRGSGDFASIAEAIYYAVDEANAHVINMSLGAHGVQNSPIMDPALAWAESKRVVVVAASGNDSDRSMISYPAIIPTVLSVGASDQQNNVTGYSNGSEHLDIVAPGGDTSADLDGNGYPDGVLQETFSRKSSGYYFFQGTSMASPHVAAVVALMLQKDPSATPSDIRARLRDTAFDLAPIGHDVDSGYGLINPAAALASTATGPTDPEPPIVNQAPVAEFEYSCVGLSCNFDASKTTDDNLTTLTFNWDFGNGESATGKFASKDYSQAGTYQVTLTVEDSGDDGLGTNSKTSSKTTSVTVTDNNTSETISLTASPSKRRGEMIVDLSWDTSEMVNVLRDGSVIAPNISASKYTDTGLGKGSGIFVYYVCTTADANNCSNALQIVF